jgi:hypothetical protein
MIRPSQVCRSPKAPQHSYIHGGIPSTCNPTPELCPCLTHKLNGILRSTLNASFSFYVHILRSPKALESFHVVPAFDSFVLCNYTTPNLVIFGTPNSRRVHTYTWGCIKCRGRDRFNVRGLYSLKTPFLLEWSKSK